MIKVLSIVAVLGAMSAPLAGVAPLKTLLGSYLVSRMDAEPMPSRLCYACVACGGEKHDMIWTTPPPGSPKYEDNHNCSDGHACEAHTQCDVFASNGQRGQLWRALDTYESGTQLRAILAAFAQVSYDATRKAFLIEECGQLTGYLPASNAQIRALE